MSVMSKGNNKNKVKNSRGAGDEDNTKSTKLYILKN